MLQSATPGLCGGRRQVALTWQVGPGGGSGGHGPLSEGRTLLHAPSAWSALVLYPQVPSALLALTPSVLTGNGRGRSAFLKAKGHRSFWRAGRWWPREDTAPAGPAPASAQLAALSFLPPLLLLCGCFNDGAKDCPCAWPLRTLRGLR